MTDKFVTSVNTDADLDGMRARIVEYPISFERMLEYEDGSKLLVHKDNVIEYKEPEEQV